MFDVAVNFIHLLATIVWIGGAFFIHFILQPSLKLIDPQQGGKLMGILSKRFSIAASTSLLLLITTGILKTPADLMFDLSTDMGVTLSIKHVLAAGMVIVGLLIGLYVVPNMKRNSPNQGETPSAQFLSFQKRLGTLAMVNLVLGMFVLIFASQLW